MNSHRRTLTFPCMHVVALITLLSCCCQFAGSVHETPESNAGEEGDIPVRPITILPGDCLHELFSKYSTDDGRVDQDGFTKLLQSLGLGEIKDTKKPAGNDDHSNDHDDHDIHDAETERMTEKEDHANDHNEHEAETTQPKTRNSVREKRAINATTNPPNTEGKYVTTPAISAQEIKTSGGSMTSDAVSQPVTNGSFGHGTHTDHHKNDYHVTQCLSAEAVLDIFDDETSASGLTQDQFFQVCPVLLQQLDSRVCVKFNVNSDAVDHSCEPGYNDMDEPTDPSQTGIPHHIWGYAFAAVTLISMASIVCILVVPCMQRFPKIYSRLLSFLVAMAVGTLSGDAVMHLMPHAFGFHGHKDLEESMILTTPIPGCEPVTSSDHHDHDSGMAISGIDWENNVVIKGLVVLMGIFSFFIIEQLMQLCRSCRQKRHKPGDNGSNYTQLKPRENVGAKLCNHSNATDRLSILADPTAAAQIDALLTTDKQEPTKASVVYKCSDDRRDSQASDASHHSSQHAVTICVHSDAQIHISPNPTYGHHHGDGDHKHKHNDHQQGGEEDGYHEDHHHHHRKNSHDKEVDLHDGHHQGHHGHSHGVPPSDAGIATLAWIVVMGDGLHNFCDGLVVGAAFADSLAGGLSTAIAVMCHELPHELGDFAVMLKAGMSVKQALAFQGVSSILAYLGMAMGVAMGNISMLSLWIFALAAGMFLYIALADLFPEMVDTTSTTKDSKCVHLLLQILGVMFGIGIMLTIGLLEEDLMAALVSRREG